jgi:hypothetical protein
MAAAVAAAALVVVPSATATIHPIAVGWVGGNASGDPPRHTPGTTHSDPVDVTDAPSNELPHHHGHRSGA